MKSQVIKILNVISGKILPRCVLTALEIPGNMTGMTAGGMAKWVITDSIMPDAKVCLVEAESCIKSDRRST